MSQNQLGTETWTITKNNPKRLKVELFDKNGEAMDITPYLNAAVGTTLEREDENACFSVSEDFLSDKGGE